MKGYSHFGFNDFVICAGYRQDVIKEYFEDYFLHQSDVTFDFTNIHYNVSQNDGRRDWYAQRDDDNTVG